ncbi:hypothetical protein [Listeria booriae]|uniref:hypothetical protein n=1 Tax=Listeria booriae TaxID=1552123 RepID=UPI00162637D9|nr:hypothetical protein [Listeria booriae]MBC1800443.1 hypothetical protein [Listeria booriae]MBC1813011.1 hypothetical protein [Listeria booriae]
METKKILIIFTVCLVIGSVIQITGALLQNNSVLIIGSVLMASGVFWMFFQLILIRAKRRK